METHSTHDNTLFGFWVYLLTDVMLFASLFAAYLVLMNGTYGGPTSSDIGRPVYVLVETSLLLLSSFTAGCAGFFMSRGKKIATIALWIITFVLGSIFMLMEGSDLVRLYGLGWGWDKSAFLSALFTLIGTHGLHVAFGLMWIIVFLIPLIREGLTSTVTRRLACLQMFWHFVNIVWIFIFTVVYLI